MINCREILNCVDGILVPGGFGVRGINGKINAIKYARENNSLILEYVLACNAP